MTKDKFQATLGRLCDRVGYPEAFLATVLMPVVCQSLAADLWVHGFSETRDTRALRYQLKALHVTGMFHFVDVGF